MVPAISQLDRARKSLRTQGTARTAQLRSAKVVANELTARCAPEGPWMEDQSSPRGGAGSGGSGGGGGPSDLSLEEFDPTTRTHASPCHRCQQRRRNSSCWSAEAALSNHASTDTVWAWAAAAVAEATDDARRKVTEASRGRTRTRFAIPRPPHGRIQTAAAAAAVAGRRRRRPPPTAGVWAWAETAIKGRLRHGARGAVEARVRGGRAQPSARRR